MDRAEEIGLVAWLDEYVRDLRGKDPEANDQAATSLSGVARLLSDMFDARRSAGSARVDARAAAEELPLWNNRERPMVDALMKERGLSEHALIRQAIRYYASVVDKVNAGETCTWSGDAQRARDFAGADLIRTEEPRFTAWHNALADEHRAVSDPERCRRQGWTGHALAAHTHSAPPALTEEERTTVKAASETAEYDRWFVDVAHMAMPESKISQDARQLSRLLAIFRRLGLTS